MYGDWIKCTVIVGCDFRYMEEKINKVHQDEDFIYPSLGSLIKFKVYFFITKIPT